MKATEASLDVETLFRALSDRTRLRILNLLRSGELCVCDLVNVLDVPQPTASRHLAYLRRAELVVSRKEGLWQHYRLSASRTLLHEKLLECVEASVALVPELTADLERLRLDGCSERCG
ncbi:ArsR/SmtB family transcription factor [Kolteria novifilia]|uniref:ArsR/SmtB family transcription factor n=1 Tax=Kolteria novifilia TaxID=2527975 RepID=UPI003AF3F7DD